MRLFLPALALLAPAALVLGLPVGAAAESGAESEREPSCEPGQDSLGYGRIPSTNREAGPFETRTCEGEHWDGQDSTSPNFANRDDCAGAFATNFALWQCADPEEHTGSILRPVGARLSIVGTGEAFTQGYAALRVTGVGKIAVYGATCQGPCPDGQDPAGILGARAALYYQDDAPLNIPFNALSALRITQDDARDGDCTQAEYEASPVTEPTCGRDNTAITTSAAATPPDASDPGSAVPPPPEACPDGSIGVTSPACVPPPAPCPDGEAGALSPACIDPSSPCAGPEGAPCIRLHRDSDGSVTLYDDRNRNGALDAGETIARIG